MPIVTPSFGIYLQDDDPADKRYLTASAAMDNDWTKEPEEFVPIMSVNIQSGKVTFINAGKGKVDLRR